MATQNYASVFSTKVDERFTRESQAMMALNNDYKFTGVKTVNVYSIPVVGLTDYTRSGTDRFGNLSELGDTVQEMVITKDRAFTFSIDKGNAAQQFNIKQANQALNRQIDEVVTPEIDIFRFGKWVAGAGKEIADGTLTKSNALEKIFSGSTAMNNLLVPKNNRTLFIKESVFFNVKLADQILNSEKLGNTALANGSVGKLDNMNVVPVPDSYFPDGVNFIIKYKGATVDPVQLKTYRVLKEQRGIDGDVVEGRIIYDSFVLETKKNGIYVSTVS
jgi:hypothetical protein